MSRYTVPCDTWGPDAGEAVVGWDHRCATYFAQTYEYGAPDDAATYAIGVTEGEIPTVCDLIRAAYAFTEIDDDTIAALLGDPGLEEAGNPPRAGYSPSAPIEDFSLLLPRHR